MHLIGSSSMSYGSNFSHPTMQNGKRSTSCSHDYAVSNDNNNRLHSRYPPATSILGRTTVGTYGQYKTSPPYGQFKTPTPYGQYKTPQSIKFDPGRFRPRDSVPRDAGPLRPTRRPGDPAVLRDSRFGTPSKPALTFDVGDLGFSGLSLSAPRCLKKSNSQQDVSRQLPLFSAGRQGLCPLPHRALPGDLGGSVGRGRMPSSFSTSAASARDSPVVFHKSVPDAVARLNRRNAETEEERKGRSGRRRGSNVAIDTAGDTSSTSSSSSSATKNSSSSSSRKSPNNNNVNNLTQKYMNKGCTGLQNIGNTCFMNCVLQCLANTRPLLELCLSSELLSEINRDSSRLRGSLVTSYVELMQSMWKGYDSISPTSFKHEVSKFARLFAGYNQQDAQEFLMYLLQGLHEELNRVDRNAAGIDEDHRGVGRGGRRRKTTMTTMMAQSDVASAVVADENVSASEKAVQSWKRHLELENSFIVDLFEGLLKSALKCRLCGYVSNTFDPFLGLSLPIKKVPGRQGETSLMECLELFTHEELLDENEKSTCDKCHRKQNSTKRLSIQKFPRILIINLKRFSEESLFRSKLSTLVRCPIRGLDLRQFSDDNFRDGAVYNLYGVCNHSGTPLGGHYTALARNPFSNDWHLFNDQRVTSVGENINLVSSEAYILFYEIGHK